jgi:hypothetical protein
MEKVYTNAANPKPKIRGRRRRKLIHRVFNKTSSKTESPNKAEGWFSRGAPPDQFGIPDAKF